MIYFEYKVGEQDYTRKYRSRIMFAHSFSYEKFAMTDSYAEKATMVNLSLDTRLKEAIINEHKEEYLKKDKNQELAAAYRERMEEL